MEVRWFRSDWSQAVHLYRKGQDRPESQAKEYFERTELFQGLFTNGNVSLLLKRVNVKDDGMYKCFVVSKALDAEGLVQLKVGNIGHEPVMKMAGYQAGGVKLTCASDEWYPEPSIVWHSANGEELPGVLEKPIPDSRGLLKVESSLQVQEGSKNRYTCIIMNKLLGKQWEAHLQISGLNMRPTVTVERISKKIAHIDTDIKFLQSCKKADKIPKGLQITIPLKSTCNSDYAERLCRRTSRTLRNHLVHQLYSKRRNLETKIESILSTCTQDTADQLRDTAKQTRQRNYAAYMKTKTRKLEKLGITTSIDQASPGINGCNHREVYRQFVRPHPSTRRNRSSQPRAQFLPHYQNGPHWSRGGNRGFHQENEAPGILPQTPRSQQRTQRQSTIWNSRQRDPRYSNRRGKSHTGLLRRVAALSWTCMLKLSGNASMPDSSAALRRQSRMSPELNAMPSTLSRPTAT
ncbi:uncharacterized protein [Heptranchias perlo]